MSYRLLALLVGLAFFSVESAGAPARAGSPGELRLTLPMSDPTARDGTDDEPDLCRAAVVTAVTLSPDGQSVAAAGDDHCIRLWDTQTGQSRHTFVGHKDWVRALRFSPSGHRLASAGTDGSLRFWALEQPASDPLRIRLANKPLQSVAFDPTGKKIATVGFGDALCLYDTTSGEESTRHACPCEDTRAVAFSDDGHWVAVAGRNGVVRLWDLTIKEGTAGRGSFDLKGDGRRVRALAFAPGGNLLATAGDGPAIRLWRLESQGESISPSFRTAGMEPMVEEILTRPGKNHSLVFISDRVLAVGGTSNTIRLFDGETGSSRGQLSGHTGTVAALATSGDGKMLVSGSFDTTVRVWSLNESITGEGRVAVLKEPAKTGTTRKKVAVVK